MSQCVATRQIFHNEFYGNLTDLKFKSTINKRKNIGDGVRHNCLKADDSYR